MREFFSRNRTHIIFLVSVITKGLHGVVELFGSILLFATGTFTSLIAFLTSHELAEDPTDFIANRVQEYLPHFVVSTQLFAAWYFLVHGIINLLLALGLLRRVLWTYPTAIIFHVLFMVYQLYRYTHTHSLTLIFLTFVDLFVIWVIWREYRFLIGKMEMRSNGSLNELK